MAGTCTPVAVDFMLPFLGKAAAGGKEVRGNRHASEDGPLESEEKDFCPHLSSYTTVTTQSWSMVEESDIKLDEEKEESVCTFSHS